MSRMPADLQRNCNTMPSSPLVDYTEIRKHNRETLKMPHRKFYHTNISASTKGPDSIAYVAVLATSK